MATRTCVFGPSPAEKLEPVEDLQGALARSPEDVPVLGWEKEELARRKANLESQLVEATSPNPPEHPPPACTGGTSTFLS